MKADRPSVVGVISEYTQLRWCGVELVGLCPFHDEKTPSFYVNEDKGVFHCFSCGEGGDVIKFIQLIEQVDFKAALAFLNLENIPRPRKSIERQAAEIITTWASAISLEISARMRILGHGLLDGEPIEGYCERQWFILETLDQDLANPQLLPELWKCRVSVKVISNE